MAILAELEQYHLLGLRTHLDLVGIATERRQHLHALKLLEGILLFIVTVLIGIAGLNKLVVDVNIANFFKEDTEFRNSIDFIDEQMTGTMDIRVRVEGNLKDPLALYEVEKIQTLLEKNSNVTTSFSIADAIKQMHRI